MLVSSIYHYADCQNLTNTTIDVILSVPVASIGSTYLLTRTSSYAD